MTEPSEHSWLARLAAAGPRLLTEAVSFVLAAGWVLWLIGLFLVGLMGAGGRFSELQGVLLVITFGLTAPLAAWLLRAHAERHGGRRSGRWWWDVGRRPAPVAVAPLGQGRTEHARIEDISMAVGAAAAFWALYAGSPAAAVVVPVAVWAVIWSRWLR
ncbi:MAG: hypothetical protein H0U62_04000 [Actinobacteria bacterium]|nr:hypothetical protein [Actinomycetota bacterium]